MTGLVSFRLEAEVLQRLGRPPVEAGRLAIFIPLLCKIALCDPGRSPVANRRQLLKGLIGSHENFFSLDQVILREQRTPQNELRSADSLEVVRSPAE